MTTVLQVIDEANELLLGGFREEISQLNGALDASQTNIVVDAGLGDLARGDLLQVDQELMYITAWSAGTNTATVRRGFNSTAVTHADDALVVVNPVVSAVAWMRHINNELRSLSSPQAGLYRVADEELTYNATYRGFDLSVIEYDDVVAVYALQPGSGRDWVPVSRSSWEVQREMETSDFSTGTALRITGGQFAQGYRVRVILKAPFALVTAFSDVVETVSGLPSTAIDLLAIGAVIRSIEGDEVARNRTDIQPTRRLSEIPPGAINASAAGLRARYAERRIEERSRLMRRHGL